MWSSIEDKIACYSELTPEERLDVEHYVAQHPAMRPLLDEAKAFSVLLDDARLLRAASPGDEALSYYIATHHVSPHPLPALLSEAFAGIEEKLTEDDALRTRYAELAQRMVVLEAATDPVQQFERLAGRRLPRPSREGPAREAAEVPAAQRLPLRRVWRHVGRWAVAAVCFGVALYGSLALVSHFSQSDLDRLAALSPSAFQSQDFEMRSGVTLPDYASSEQRYEQALESLRQSRRHTFGLFPRYDQARLGKASDLLEQVVAQDPEESPLRSEANYLLAKIRLAQENVDGAKVALHAVLEGSGWKVVEAQTLLDDLERLSPAKAK